MQTPESQPVYLAAARRIISFVKAQKLKVGENLPPESKLSRLLGCSDHAIRAAMNLLTRHGVLSRRRRQGTRLLDLNLTPMGIWSVGITARPATPGFNLSFESYLLHIIRTKLSEKGVIDRTLLEHGPAQAMREEELPQLNPLLPALWREDLIQGLVTCRCVSVPNRPILHVGSWEDAPWGVAIDTASMVRKSFDIMAGKSPLRTAFICFTKPEHGFNRAYLEYVRLCGERGMPPQLFHGESWYDFSSTRQIAGQILSLPPQKRPQVLIFIDDVMAYWVSHDLAERSSYRPALFVSANDNILVTFPLETTVFLVDVEEMGRLAAEEMFSALGAPEVPHLVRWVEPKTQTDGSRRSASSEREKLQFAGKKSSSGRP